MAQKQKPRAHAKPSPRAGRPGGPEKRLKDVPPADDADFEEKLTYGQRAVLDVLEDAESPMSAYEILDEVRRRDPECSVRAPQQVYRALDKLVSIEHAHRVESLNAFVYCGWDEDKDHPLAALTVCIECGKHTEVPDRNGAMKTQLEKFARQGGVTLEDAVVELHGICRSCR